MILLMVKQSQEMLEILNVEDIDYKKININRRKTKKTQIMICDTHRRFDDFISKIKYRKNGNYEDIPHFVITKLGHVYQLFDSDYYSNTFDDVKTNKRQIKIAIENLGWLSKNTITGFLYNWIGDPYRSDPHVRNWRNKFFWDKYNEEQMNSLKNLCKYLCEKHKIPFMFVGANGYFKNSPNFNGIVCKSNFSDIYMDINPSFNFKIFQKNE